MHIRITDREVIVRINGDVAARFFQLASGGMGVRLFSAVPGNES